VADIVCRLEYKLFKLIRLNWHKTPFKPGIGAGRHLQSFRQPFRLVTLTILGGFLCATASAADVAQASTVQYDGFLGPTSATTFVSARAGASFSNVSLEFFIDNLLDSHTITSISHSTPDGAGPQPPVGPLYNYTTFRPRTFGLTFIYRN
jgi:hypothetical protein